jgi:hypothetical protein
MGKQVYEILNNNNNIARVCKLYTFSLGWEKGHGRSQSPLSSVLVLVYGCDQVYVVQDDFQRW